MTAIRGPKSVEEMRATFGRRLRVLRLWNGLSEAEMAAVLDISVRTLKRREAGTLGSRGMTRLIIAASWRRSKGAPDWCLAATSQTRTEMERIAAGGRRAIAEEAGRAVDQSQRRTLCGWLPSEATDRPRPAGHLRTCAWLAVDLCMQRDGNVPHGSVQGAGSVIVTLGNTKGGVGNDRGAARTRPSHRWAGRAPGGRGPAGVSTDGGGHPGGGRPAAWAVMRASRSLTWQGYAACPGGTAGRQAR